MHRPQDAASPSQSVLLTGASSGIGRELAVLHASPGVVLHLGGRHKERLDCVADHCRAMGATVTTCRVDVTDAEAMARWVWSAEDYQPLDVVVANAGIARAAAGHDGEPDNQVMQVNAIGTLNTILPALPAMRKRRRGQIVLVSSLAGFRGRQGSPSYCASKAALRIWGEGLRAQLAPDNIGVTVVCPGPVHTPMTAGMAAAGDGLAAWAAARLIREGVLANRSLVGFPRSAYLRAHILAALPPSLREWLAMWKPLRHRHVTYAQEVPAQSAPGRPGDRRHAGGKEGRAGGRARIQ